MAQNTEEKNPKTIATSLQPDAPLTPGADDTQKSWGEKYKTKAFSFTRNTLVNFVVNFLGAAALTFAFDASPLGKTFRNFSKTTSEKFNHHIPQKVSEFIINFFVRAQLLLCSGHVLLPVIKWMKEHQKRLEFRIGHGLDALQEMLGMGNAASRHSLEEYNRVTSLLSIGDHNKKNLYKLSIPALSKEDIELLAKNGIDENLEFKEKKQPWHKVFKARLAGMAVTTTMAIGMGLLSAQKRDIFNFEKTYEQPIGKWLGKKVIAKIPIIARVFNKPEVMVDMVAEGEKALTGHELIGKYLVDEVIFTAGSNLGFYSMERKHARQEAEEEMKERKKMIAEGPKDFRTREATRPEPTVAIT